jgi:hypothetical protein
MHPSGAAARLTDALKEAEQLNVVSVPFLFPAWPEYGPKCDRRLPSPSIIPAFPCEQQYIRNKFFAFRPLMFRTHFAGIEKITEFSGAIQCSGIENNMVVDMCFADVHGNKTGSRHFYRS